MDYGQQNSNVDLATRKNKNFSNDEKENNHHPSNANIQILQHHYNNKTPVSYLDDKEQSFFQENKISNKSKSPIFNNSVSPYNHSAKNQNSIDSTKSQNVNFKQNPATVQTQGWETSFTLNNLAGTQQSNKEQSINNIFGTLANNGNTISHKNYSQTFASIADQNGLNFDIYDQNVNNQAKPMLKSETLKNESLVISLKQQLEIQTKKLTNQENKNRLLKDYIKDQEEDSLKKRDGLKSEIKELQKKFQEKESLQMQIESKMESYKYTEFRLRDEIVKTQSMLTTAEQKLEDKDQTINRLNSRLQNLERLGGALEQKGDELHELDSKFHKEREIRLVIERELDIIQKENKALEERLDSKEQQKYAVFEQLNEHKRLVADRDHTMHNLEQELK